MNGPSPSGRTYEESQLDLCVATLAQVSLPLHDRLWQESGQQPVPMWPSTVLMQPQRQSDLRPSDVGVLAADGRVLHIENKRASGSFGPGQLEGYQRERDEFGAAILLVAPSRFLAAHNELEHWFSGWIATEELAEELRRGIPSSEPLRSVESGWAAWLDEFSVQGGYVGQPHEQADWVAWYREFVETESAGTLRLDQGTMKFGRASFAEFADGTPASAPLSLTHKITFGVLDLRVPGWIEEELIDQVAAGPPLPEGWHIARPKSGRPDKNTGAPTPVIRFEVQPLGQPFPSPADSVHAVREMVTAGLKLRNWLRSGGEALLRLPHERTNQT